MQRHCLHTLLPLLGEPLCKEDSIIVVIQFVKVDTTHQSQSIDHRTRDKTHILPLVLHYVLKENTASESYGTILRCLEYEPEQNRKKTRLRAESVQILFGLFS